MPHRRWNVKDKNGCRNVKQINRRFVRCPDARAVNLVFQFWGIRQQFSKKIGLIQSIQPLLHSAEIMKLSET